MIDRSLLIGRCFWSVAHSAHKSIFLDSFFRRPAKVKEGAKYPGKLGVGKKKTVKKSAAKGNNADFERNLLLYVRDENKRRVLRYTGSTFLANIFLTDGGDSSTKELPNKASMPDS